MRLDRLNCLIPPPIIFALAAAAMWYAARITGRLAMPPSVRHLGIAVFLAISAVLGLSGIFFFRRAKTIINPHKPDLTSTLVTNGIYRFTRNPMYLGLVAALIAWAFHLSSPLPLLGPFLFAAYIARFQILPEEYALAKKFGDHFQDYKRRVRRWI